MSADRRRLELAQRHDHGYLVELAGSVQTPERREHLCIEVCRGVQFVPAHASADLDAEVAAKQSLYDCRGIDDERLRRRCRHRARLGPRRLPRSRFVGDVYARQTIEAVEAAGVERLMCSGGSPRIGTCRRRPQIFLAMSS